jgi:hypothetical protein
MGHNERNKGEWKIDRLTKIRITNKPIMSIRILLVFNSQQYCFLQAVHTQDTGDQNVSEHLMITVQKHAKLSVFEQSPHN